jgi:anti-sigma factor RsiW
MTPCERKHGDILDFEDGELDAARKKEVKRHLDECCDCNKLLRQIRLQRAALKRCASLKTNDSFFILLQERIRREKAGKRSPGAWPVFGMPRWVPASAFALVLVVTAGWMLVKRSAPAVTAQGAAKKTFASQAPSRPVPQKVQYVIDEYPRTRPKAAAGGKDGVQAAAADTNLRVKNFDALKGRLTPVSF